MKEIAEPSACDFHQTWGMVNARSSSSGMTCGEARRHFVDYMEGDLDQESAAHLLKHLESCRKCESDLKGIQNVTRLLGGLAEFDLPAEFRVGSQYRNERKGLDG